MDNKTSLGSKILTTAFCGLLVLMTIAAFIYLSLAPDFISPKDREAMNAATAPSTLPEGQIDYEALYNEALYNATMQDMLDYLEEKGYINQADKVPMSIIGTENWICSGLDLIWWDVANLEEGTEPNDYWQQFQEDGYILYGSIFYAPNLYGPYAIYVNTDFVGNTEQLEADMQAFGQYLYEKYPPEAPPDYTALYNEALYNATMQDMLDYLEEKGHIHQDDKIPMSTIGTENWICSGLDLMWWDVDNLVEGTEAYDYWQQFQENGYIVFGGSFYAPELYGPFGINVLTGFAGDPKQLAADMKAFGQWLYERNLTQ